MEFACKLPGYHYLLVYYCFEYLHKAMSTNLLATILATRS
nr:MAG TPA: hypothetical protein [Caudoviricetes sp.]